ncbi:unnamed protein product [Clonostachys solani]|uniref:Heterokaryon incompatibility domain-containing protein n=1 Tax=Clonostachys solani TaxID=160281 RepID=A0A9N9ZAA3_9HYPO|nr:unnamed protein product [Clonostachys solani]
MAAIKQLITSAVTTFHGQPSRDWESTDDIQLCNEIWPALVEAYPLHPDQYSHLATFAKDQISKLRTLRLQRPGTEADIVRLVKDLHTLINEPREDVIQRFQRFLQLDEESSADQNSVTRVLEILASLYLTTTIAIERDPEKADHAPIKWEKSICLQAAINSYMEREEATEWSISKSTIDQRLKLHSLVANYGFEVDWTNDFNEHLRIDESTKVISIYEHKVWLYAHLRPNTQCPLPRTAMEECLDTLNILFPHHEPSTAAFLKSRGRSFHLLGSCGRKPSRDLRDYPRWGRNLDQLLRVLEGPPSGIRQLLPKPKEGKLLDLVNFWIAVSVAFLTGISFVFGLMAVIFAKMSYDVSLESLRVTREQYLLSLAQACSDKEVPDALVLPPGDSAQNFTNKFSFKAQDIWAASNAGCALFQECTRVLRGLGEDQKDVPVSLRVGFRNGRVFLKVANRRASWYEAYTNENDPCSSFILARSAYTNQNATHSLSLAREWLSSCLENTGTNAHHRCVPPNPTGFMPSLILRITPDNGSFRLNLCKPDQTQVGRYACLSYCWGGDQKTKLGKSNRSAWLTDIPVADLPIVVVEAITVLMSLQFNNLWVDALCIVQDDKEDVSKQVGMMPQIYQNATVTITASTSSTCYESFLKPKSPPPLYRAGLALAVELPNTERGTMFLRDCDDDVPFREPVSQRAWTLQENILSPRLLEYGYERVRWSCRSLQTSQGGSIQSPGQYSSRFIFYNSLGSNIGAHPHDQRAVAWWRVLSDFTRRGLSFPTDKLPAISAIASELAASSEPRDDYLAGLWRRDLPLHLLWRADFPRRARPRSYRAPSWSWAAVESPVFHPHASDGEEEWARTADLARCLTVVGYSAEPVSPAAMYAGVRSAHLIVRGFVLDARLFRTGTEYEIQSPLIHLQERTKTYYPDAIEDEGFLAGSAGRDVSLLLIIPHSTESSPQGIVLIQRENEQTFSRIGYFILKTGRGIANSQDSTKLGVQNTLPPGDWTNRNVRIE